jgi:hypothetical protein
MCGDEQCEQLVATISDGMYNVTSLGEQITEWVTLGFPLNHDNSLHGKHHAHNYKSAVKQFNKQTTKSLLKRLD